jgi:general stress protein 26
MTRDDLLRFMRSCSLAVQGSVSPSGVPQSAVVGIVVSDDLHVFFDTLDTSRKAQNLRRNPRVSFVIGGAAPGDERTVQYEGIADEPRGTELEALKALYLERFPDGLERLKWPGLIYIRATPTWIRYSDYSCQPPDIVEFRFGESGAAERPSDRHQA